MTSNFRPYPRMGNSDVQWLGDVPAHWEIKPARALFAEVMDQNHPDEPLLSVTIGKGVVRQSDLLASSSKKDSSNQDKTKYKLVLPGDITYNKMRAWQGAVGCSAHRGIVSPAYIVQRPRAGVSARFMHYLLRTPDFAKEAERWSYGITSDQWSLRPEHFKMIYCCLPPPSEQEAIVRFLDHAARRVGKAIQAKQKLIKLLEEERQAIIHRVITHGLNSDVRLKSSGVEWLGEIPDHWEVQRLGRIARVFNGSTPSRMEPAYWRGGTIPWISSGKVNDVVIEKPSDLVTERALQECSISLVPKGAVVIGLVGQGKTRGKSAMLGIDACINQNMAAIIPRRPLTSSYLNLFFMAFYNTLREFGRGGNQEALNCEIVANWRVAIPPFHEQSVICGAIRNDVVSDQAAQSRAHQEIVFLREYHTRLIADVVTGKLDVREAAARLPKDTSEVKATDEAEDWTDQESTESGDADEVAAEEIEA